VIALNQISILMDLRDQRFVGIFRKSVGFGIFQASECFLDDSSPIISETFQFINIRFNVQTNRRPLELVFFAPNLELPGNRAVASV